MEHKIKNKKYTIKDIINSQDYSKVDSLFFKKYILIPLAWPFTWIFLKLNITANQTTLLRLFFFLIAVGLIAVSNSYLAFFFIFKFNI